MQLNFLSQISLQFQSYDLLYIVTINSSFTLPYLTFSSASRFNHTLKSNSFSAPSFTMRLRKWTKFD